MRLGRREVEEEGQQRCLMEDAHNGIKDERSVLVCAWHPPIRGAWGSSQLMRRVHNARHTLYSVYGYLADGDECDICGGCRAALMHIRCIPRR